MTRRALLGAAAALGWGGGVAAAPTLARPARPALQVARPTQAVLMAVGRAGRRLVAVGERGLVIGSDDEGRSWTQAAVPVSSTLTALRFADERRGWAVGNLGVVLQTQDGGRSWIKVLDGEAAARLALQAARDDAQREEAQRLVDEGADKPFLDLALRADGSVYVVGAYGLAYASGDAGKTWQPQMARLPNPEGLSYYGMVERRAGESLLFGEQGLLLKAAGPDQPFAAQASPASGSLFASVALREGPLLLLGLRGKVYRHVGSPGRDEPWTLLQTHVEASLLAGQQLADGRVLLAGAAGQLLLSHDGGQRLRPLFLQKRFPFTGMAETADGGLLLVGMRGLQRLDAGELNAAAKNHDMTRTPAS